MAIFSGRIFLTSKIQKIAKITRVSDPYSFFTDPDPEDPDGGQYGSGYGSGSGSNGPIEYGSNTDPDTDTDPDPKPCVRHRVRKS